MIHLSISDHKLIRARSFYYEPSFPCALEGMPTADMISKRLKEARSVLNTPNSSLLSRFIDSLKRSDHIFYEDSFDKEDLPSYYCVADFESSDPTDGTSMFSYLTVSWFMSINDELGILGSIEEALKNFRWEKYAKNGDY